MVTVPYQSISNQIRFHCHMHNRTTLSESLLGPGLLVSDVGCSTLVVQVLAEAACTSPGSVKKLYWVCASTV